MSYKLYKLCCFFLFFVAFGSSISLHARDASNSPAIMLEEIFAESRSDLLKNKEFYKENPVDLYYKLKRYIELTLHSPSITKLVLGRYWKNATEKQRQDFGNAFISSALISNMHKLLYSKEDITIELLSESVHQDDDNKIDVSFMIKHPKVSEVEVVFQMKNIENIGWRAYNIIAENRNMAINYRNIFYPLLRKNGIDSVIQKMLKK